MLAPSERPGCGDSVCRTLEATSGVVLPPSKLCWSPCKQTWMITSPIENGRGLEDSSQEMVRCLEPDSAQVPYLGALR